MYTNPYLRFMVKDILKEEVVVGDELVRHRHVLHPARDRAAGITLFTSALHFLIAPQDVCTVSRQINSTPSSVSCTISAHAYIPRTFTASPSVGTEITMNALFAPGATGNSWYIRVCRKDRAEKA